MTEPALDAMSKQLPCSEPQLANMPGIGINKAKKYGKTFLPVIWECIIQFDINVPYSHLQHIPKGKWESACKKPPSLSVGVDATISAPPAASSTSNGGVLAQYARIPLRPVSTNTPRPSSSVVAASSFMTPLRKPLPLEHSPHFQQPMQQQRQASSRPQLQQQRSFTLIGQKRPIESVLRNNPHR